MFPHGLAPARFVRIVLYGAMPRTRLALAGLEITARSVSRQGVRTLVPGAQRARQADLAQRLGAMASAGEPAAADASRTSVTTTGDLFAQLSPRRGRTGTADVITSGRSGVANVVRQRPMSPMGSSDSDTSLGRLPRLIEAEQSRGSKYMAYVQVHAARPRSVYPGRDTASIAGGHTY